MLRNAFGWANTTHSYLFESVRSHLTFSALSARCWPWCVVLAHVPFISAYCIPVSLKCYQETSALAKMLSSIPAPFGNVPGKAVCIVCVERAASATMAQLTHNGTFQSKCVMCLDRGETGLNTDTDSTSLTGHTHTHTMSLCLPCWATAFQ